MKRVAFTLMVFLLFGAIVNVAVAWGCVQWSSKLRMQPREMASESASQFWSDDVAMHRKAIEPWRFGHVSTQVYAGFGVLQHGYACYLALDHMAVRFGVALDVQAGWPARSLQGGATFHRDPYDHWVRTGTIASPLTVADSQWTVQGWRDVPLLPILPGFAINTVFYAALLWGLFFTSGAIRRTIRIKRGLCTACGYPIGTSPVCTECGQPVARTITA